MIAEVYDALRSAGADEEKARAAATAVAGQLDGETRLGHFEARFDKIESDLGRLDTRFEKIEAPLDRLESRAGKLDADVGVLKWMVGFTLAFQVATLFFIWQVLLKLPA